MKYEEFEVGKEFRTHAGRWRCTDKGQRTIIAIRIDRVKIAGTVRRVLLGDEAEAEGWFNGPPYAVLERVFDENDQQGCYTKS